MSDTQVYILWKDTGPVKTQGGFCIVPDRTLRDAPRLDLLVVPGGLGQQDLMEDDEILNFLKLQAETARYMVSVCTGSLLLAAAGLLRGYRATCHWMFLPLLKPLGAIPTAERVVKRRTGLPRVELSPPRSLTARWTALNDSCGKNIQQENVSSPLEVRNRVLISSVRRMTSSSPAN